MKEVRLSIPVIGGITVIYTQEEINSMKAKVKQRADAAAAFTVKHSKETGSKLSVLCVSLYTSACELKEQIW